MKRPQVNPVTKYAVQVLDGTILAGPPVRQACVRHMADLEQAGKRGWSFSLERVEHVLSFFREVLCLNAGEFEGKPFEVAPWQAFVLGSLFGWIDAEGCRRFRTAFVETGKGSGKSPLAAGIGLYMMVIDGEARAEIYSAAGKKDQAMILFRDAVAMVEQSKALARRIRVIGGVNPWNMSFEGSFFRAISSDDKQSGPRPHCSLLDEVHEHADDTMIEMMRAGFKFRRQPLLFLITNSGVDRTTVCWRLHDHALKVASRTLEDDRFFSYVCALDEADDPLEDEACWPKTNPSLGITIRHDYLRDQVREAKQMPAKESTVRRLNFCQWVDAATPWISGEAWRACEVEEAAPLPVLFKDLEVVLGLDLSATTDLTALALAADASGRMRVAVEFWTPGDTLLARAERDSVPYELWRDQGFLNALPGKTIDYGALAERIAEIVDQLNVKALVFDRYRMSYLRRELEVRGLALPLIEHPQGFVKPAGSALWMPQSINELESAILGRTLDIRRNPVLTWNAASAVAITDLNNSRVFSKRKSTGRIDGLVALAMAVGALRAPQQVLDVESWIA